MKQITRNLAIYAVEIHLGAAELGSKLGAFVDIGKHERLSCGFVPPINEDEALVVAIPGGWAASFRQDTKLLPASAVNEAINAECEQIERTTGRKPGKKERKEIKADVMYELLAKAFSRTSLTTLLYSSKSKRLYVATGSTKVADTCMSELVRALESVKSSTVHVSGVSQGLTKRLTNYLDDAEPDQAFGDFYPQGDVVMSGGKRKWALKGGTVRDIEPALRNAIGAKATVDSIAFDWDGIEFRITDSLRIKGVKHRTAEPGANDTLADQWVAQATLELDALDVITHELLDLLDPARIQTVDDEELFA